MNKNILNFFLSGLVALVPVNSARSAAIFENSNFTVYFPTISTQITDSLLALGYFTGGFTPTSGNISSWFNNFVGIDAGVLKQGGSLGYYTLGADPDASVSLPLGLNEAGQQYELLAPIGTRLSVIGVNKASSSSSISGATAGFVLTDTSWIIPTITTANIASDVLLAFTSNTSATVGVLAGSAPSSYTITMIPEPSSMSLVIMGLATALAFRRKHASLKEVIQMNITNKIAQATLVALAISLTPHLSAQSNTVSTPIVGFQKTTVPVGLSTAGFPLLNLDLIKTSATSLSSNALSLTGESNVGSKLTAGEPYYIEVYSGDLKGDRFDVNTSSTISAANGSVILDSTSANNTYPFASIGSKLDGAVVALRKHITLAQVRTSASTPFVGNNNQSLADQISLFDSSTATFNNYFLRGDNVTWRKVGTTTTANNTPIPPGVGVFITKNSSATEITVTGVVRQNDFAMPLQSGLQLVAPAFPIDNSPSSLGGTATNGWSGNNNQSLADQIAIFDQSTTTYKNYFLRGDGTTWRLVGTTTSVTSSNIVSSGQAFFITRNLGDVGYGLINPIPQ